MKFGICLPIRLDAAASTNVKIAKAAEALGFDSVWASDHVVIPARRSGIFTEYFYDPFTLLAFISSVTSRILLGTSVIILPYRNPLVTAKMAASLDVVSGGRLLFGVGPGWMREEFEALGIPYESRGRMTDEYIEIIKTLWEKDDPKYEGEFFTFYDVGFDPKPLQKPGPTVWIAGSSERAMRRAALYGNGWQPTGASPDDVAEGIQKIRSIAVDAGREASGIKFSVRNRVKILGPGLETKSEPNAPTVFTMRGTPDEIAECIQEYKSRGVSHMIFDPDAGDTKEIFDMMETLSKEVLSSFKE